MFVSAGPPLALGLFRSVALVVCQGVGKVR